MTDYIYKGFLWLGAIVVAIIPGIIAFDSGGVLPWSYWALSAALVIPSLCAFAALRGEHSPHGLQPHILTLLLAFMGLFALFQTVPLPGSLAKFIASGSYDAWTQWQVAGLPDSAPYGVDRGIPISVAPHFTRQYAWLLFSMAAATWCGTMLFSSRERVAWLLIAFSMIGSIYAGIGLWQVFSFPDQTALGFSANSPFGVFVNRNNASALFNLSLACSLGLLGWRLSAVTGYEFGQHGFSFSNLFDLAADRPSIFAFTGVLANTAGLLACGSRGGLGGAIVGVALGLGMLKVSGILPKLFSAILVIVVLAMVLLINVEVAPRSLERFGAMAEGFNDSILTDGRLPHWKESIVAAQNYLPSGSGMGTYKYAYLPYQELGSDRWFINADNLWLEWLVEGGLVAIVILIVGLLSITYGLLQLRNTPDPMDHGIATAGWVAMFAMGFSQFFDFGLLLAGTAALASVLFGAVLGRASTEGIPLFAREREDGDRLKFAENQRNWLTPATGVIAVVVLLISSSGLRDAASEDSVVRSTEIVLAQDDEADLVLRQLEELQNNGSINPDVSYAIARIFGAQLKRSLHARMADSAELSEFVPRQPALVLGVIRRLETEIRAIDDDEISQDVRQGLLRELEMLVSQEAAGDLKNIREKLRTTLALAPLSSEARLSLIDYTVEADAEVDLQSLYEQILQLRRGTSRSLGALARFAAEHGDWDTATSALQSLVARQPRRVKILLDMAREMGHPDPILIVTDDEDAIERALEFQYRYLPPSPTFYTRAVEILTKQYPEDRVERSARYQQLAELYSRLEQYDKSYDFYLKAIDLDPMDLEARLAYVDTLAQQGELIQAKRYAEGLTEIFGESNSRIERSINRLTKMIEKMNETAGTR